MIEAIIAGLALGVTGSVHCVGMCGPLALMLPVKGSPFQRGISTVVYHLGRISSYILLGLILSGLLEYFDLFKYERWVSLTIGVVFLLLWLLEFLKGKSNKIGPLQQWINKSFGVLVSSNHPLKWWLAGMLNGLLPCGLVYGALIASAGFGGVGESAIFMIGFGLGNSPVLWLITMSKELIGKKIQGFLRTLLPFWLLIMAVFFILRGANLGIPFLSPKIKAHQQEAPSCCHPKK